MKTASLTGTIRGTRSGFIFLVPDDGGEDLLVRAEATGGAVHGDHVRASLEPSSVFDFRPAVQVDEILGRPASGFTGNLFRLGRGWFVRPDSPLLPERLRIRLGPAAGIAGAKVLFRVENHPGPERAPVAAFERMLGEGDDARLDPLVIGAEFSLDPRFPEEALLEAESRAALSRDPEDETREDFREQLVLTIDPVDAKDFDDAVALETRPEGWRLFVHIADVSFYVPEGGPLDQEAARRGTSVYFPGSVVPMLPEGISSLAASLVPGEDRRTVSVVIDFDRDGRRQVARVTRGWIRSHARLHYQQAQRIVDGQAEAPEEIVTALRAMDRLARRLRALRFASGGFELDVPESRMELGPDGVPVRIRRHEALDSHRLIEEFMIAANHATGAWAASRSFPFLYRVHQEPDASALEQFCGVALALMPGTSVASLSSLPRLRGWIEALPDSPVGRIVQRYFLRSLKKAVYSPVDLGHFGLGIREYSHFTSPIRRYPDLFNHRRVKELIDGRGARVSFEQAHADALRSSRREINAEEAGREMLRLKAARFMERRLGEIHAGHVTGLLPAGLFVELDTMPVEGFIPRLGLPAGFRLVDERMAFVDARSRDELRAGDPVRVQVARVDLRLRRVEFALVGERAEGRPERGARGSRRGRRTSGRSGESRSGSPVRTKKSGGGRRRAAGAGPAAPGGRRGGKGTPPKGRSDRAGRGRPKGAGHGRKRDAGR